MDQATLVDRHGRPLQSTAPIEAAADNHLTGEEAGWLITSLGGGGPTSAGVRVSPETAMRVSTVFACIELRAGTLKSLPLKLYRRVGEDRAPATDHRLYRMVHSRPNRWQTMVDWVFMSQAHIDQRGNAYSRKIFNGRGEILELIPMHPDRTVVRKTDDGDFFYDYYAANGRVFTGLTSEEVLHHRGPSLDGDMGVSRVTYAREVIGRDIAARDYGSRFFANDARPMVYLKHKKRLSPEAKTRLKSDWKEKYGGANRHSVAVLEEDLDVATIGLTNDESQFLETMNFSIPDICRFFDVPPMMVGHDGKTATYASADVMLEMFKTLTMVEIARAWEQRLNADLLTEREQETLYFEFEMAGLERGSLEARGNYYQQAVGRPWMTADEARRRENMAPISGGNTLANPLNMGGAPKETP